MKTATCLFCKGPSTLLCDGKMLDGKTCDKPVCRQCAKKVADYHLNRGRKGCSWDTFDLCPDCVKAGRGIA